MKPSKIATAALAAIAMLGASPAFAAVPAASKLSLASAQSVRIGGVQKRVTNRQSSGAGLNQLLANPIVIASIVATAIAVPVALANSDPSSP